MQLGSKATKGNRHLGDIHAAGRYGIADILDSRVAIVTGSARGIGRAVALRIARDGYDVCINDIAANEAGSHQVAQEIRDLGRKSIVATADVRNLGEVQRMVQTTVDELGPLNTM